MKPGLGIVVQYNNERLFYSILDDCFFRILSSSEEHVNDLDKYANRIFTRIYADGNSHIMPIGIELHKRLKTDFLTKEEIITNKKLITGYYSDFNYKLSIDTNVDY